MQIHTRSERDLKMGRFTSESRQHSMNSLPAIARISRDRKQCRKRVKTGDPNIYRQLVRERYSTSSLLRAPTFLDLQTKMCNDRYNGDE